MFKAPSPKIYEETGEKGKLLLHWSPKITAEAKELRIKPMLNIYVVQDCFLQNIAVMTDICLL
jgi:hypothetical protein